ncbi:alcohol dehydrogenase [Streptomyces rubellomurinus subsp. indigoferus]|uniref:Alcohol dehydrogenase n=1 Tax=Streptomyces rubellomurinus (strain ATCC 31215) TaxID=359131 RepID=A0A0F2TDZ6_STRR3|nr:aldo/keto reductase [Streptomyces rubellomurinus]KJS52488.1 alcohol dehydrogenase [Streptomyces rubellomurinus subsp. indigoferus]KJS60741.1 alcohol dehydrogenase [Streptomyces rubellomurinus]
MTGTPSRVRLGSSDLSVFPLSLGGNVFGWTADEQQSFAVLDAYTAAGGNFIDTADVYSAWAPGNTGGESETVIGAWLRSRGNRDDVVIATKVGMHPEASGLSAATIKASAEGSLRRLGVDHIDLYYTHRDDETPVEEFVTALDELVREGKVRAVAASNIGAERLAEALAFAEREGLAPYVAVQPHYNLVSRATFEGPLAEVVAEHGLATVPYYALASGFLTGKYRPGGPEVPSARAEGAARYLAEPRGPKVLEALDTVAAEHGVEVATVALAWLAARPTVAAPIASARTVDQLPPLLAAAALELTPAQTALLDDASA